MTFTISEKNGWLSFGIFIAILACIGMLTPFVTPYMTWAAIAYVLMAFGFLLRENRRVHVPLMLSAILADVSLVLLLQFQRHAIQTAASFKLGVWQQAHIGFSTLALVLYFPILYLGVRAYWFNTTASQRSVHKRLGYLAFVFRTLGFLLMYSMLKGHE